MEGESTHPGKVRVVPRGRMECGCHGRFAADYHEYARDLWARTAERRAGRTAEVWAPRIAADYREESGARLPWMAVDCREERGAGRTAERRAGRGCHEYARDLWARTELPWMERENHVLDHFNPHTIALLHLLYSRCPPLAPPPPYAKWARAHCGPSGGVADPVGADGACLPLRPVRIG
jgi:hypothetical protein